MDPEVAARYEAQLRQTAWWTVLFLLLTYGPLQVAALWRSTGWKRIAAALPLLVMTPLIVAGGNPNTHRDGSLYGLYIVCPFLPVLIYLMGILIDPHANKPCPHCGHVERVRSFRFLSKRGPCTNCGKRHDEPAIQMGDLPEPTSPS